MEDTCWEKIVLYRGIFYVITSTQSHKPQLLEIFNFLVKPVRETDHLATGHKSLGRTNHAYYPTIILRSFQHSVTGWTRQVHCSHHYQGWSLENQRTILQHHRKERYLINFSNEQYYFVPKSLSYFKCGQEHEGIYRGFARYLRTSTFSPCF